MKTLSSSQAVEEVGLLVDSLYKGIQKREDASTLFSSVGETGTSYLRRQSDEVEELREEVKLLRSELSSVCGSSEQEDVTEILGERDKAMAQFEDMIALLSKAEDDNTSLESQLRDVKAKLRHHEQQAVTKQREIARLTAELNAQQALSKAPVCTSCEDNTQALLKAEQEIDSLMSQNETLLEQLELQLQG
eukprot:TRINITY_DN6609_c4_g1_i1.p1 TRINITY_DN6609_c4_g1~~TRINITY_DN6609_c4_g1_i1.p1  ORF type:complete len:206 (+),score=50.39 TRINITY_DN6609_c4_g1_i1:48-620(+)